MSDIGDDYDICKWHDEGEYGWWPIDDGDPLRVLLQRCLDRIEVDWCVAWAMHGPHRSLDMAISEGQETLVPLLRAYLKTQGDGS